MADNPWNEEAAAQNSAVTKVPAEQRQDVIEKILLFSYKEQQRTRRWSIFFKLLTFAYLFFLLFLFLPRDFSEVMISKDYTALIEIKGLISDTEDASADNIVTALREAFKDESTKGIILRINSPGGSAVQAGYVYDEIKRLRQKHPKIKVYAVITDMGASGAYYIAAAADAIYADKASLVGSIGVLMSSFGFVDTMKKLGVERRLLVAGKHKGFMDPFSPLSAKEKTFIETMLKGVHEQFIASVKLGRGERLKSDPLIFSGLIWTGEKAVELGLVDGLGSASYVAREVIGAEKMLDYTKEINPLEEFSKGLGAQISQHLSSLLGLNSLNLR